MSAFFRFVEYAGAALLWVTPELAAAGFSGLVTVGGRGGIDGGNDRFGDADFGSGDFGGPIGSRGFGTHRGNGGCVASALRLGEVGGTSSALSVVTIGLGPSACLILEPGCMCSRFTRLVSFT